MEISLSTIAWVSVVLVQALVHYLVFGARQERLQQEKEQAALVEESLSLATNESFVDAAENELLLDSMEDDCEQHERGSRMTTPRRRRLSASSSSSLSPTSTFAVRDIYFSEHHHSHGGIGDNDGRNVRIRRRRSLGSLSPTITRTVLKIGDGMTISSALEPSPLALSQTGTEMFKVCSIDCRYHEVSLPCHSRMIKN